MSVSTVVPTRLVSIGSGTGRSGAIGSVASRAMSMNCSDIRMLPSPSAMAWWSFWIIAARSPSSALDDEELPQRAGAVERGADERGGEVEQLPHRARGWAAPTSGGGSRGRSRARRATPAAPAARGPGRRAAGAAAPARWRAGAGCGGARDPGAWSSRVTLAIDELRCGSFSRFHISASTSVIRRSLRISRASQPWRRTLGPSGRISAGSTCA